MKMRGRVIHSIFTVEPFVLAHVGDNLHNNDRVAPPGLGQSQQELMGERAKAGGQCQPIGLSFLHFFRNEITNALTSRTWSSVSGLGNLACLARRKRYSPASVRSACAAEAGTRLGP